VLCCAFVRVGVLVLCGLRLDWHTLGISVALPVCRRESLRSVSGADVFRGQCRGENSGQRLIQTLSWGPRCASTRAEAKRQLLRPSVVLLKKVVRFWRRGESGSGTVGERLF
jgi:hypothetical protein